MSAGHTPGPWFVVPYGDGDSLVICSDQGGEWRICFMATHGGTPSVWQAIQANARLIAAAPELMEALEHLLKVRERGDAAPQSRDAAEAKARRVIAKARGES